MKHAHGVPAADGHRYRTARGRQLSFRVRGEYHLINPSTVSKLQHAVRQNELRDLPGIRRPDRPAERAALHPARAFRIQDAATPVPLEEVEPASEIVKRFATGAMSFGSIRKEAHETLAIAMNRIGGKSNTGEGGEDEARFKPRRQWRFAPQRHQAGGLGTLRRDRELPGQCRRSADQDGAGREARRRRPASRPQNRRGHRAECVIPMPGVGLISPPPHHDIYSIEDLAQLIYDLKNVNPQARISVKLVAEVGVGTVAAGVSKAHADVVLISGHDGGTGASPLTSLKHAGAPWELGLAETQQVLVMNDLRGRITRADRRQTADRPRRRHRRTAGRRGVRFLHHAAGGDGLHHDAQVPPEYLPGRHRHAGSRAAQAKFTGQPEHVDQFLLLHRRTGAGDHGAARFPQDGRDGGPRRHAGYARRRRALESARTGFFRGALQSADARRASRRHCTTSRIMAWTKRSTTS